MMLARANCRELPLSADSVDLIFTDPPYLREFLPRYGWLAHEAMRVLKPGGFVLAMCGGMYVNQIYRMFDDAGLTYFFEAVQETTGDAPTCWRDGYPVVAKAKPMLIYSKGPGRPRVGGMFNLFRSQGGWSKLYHHWGQDVGSARYYIDHLSAPGDLVLDPFVGGGTTLVACELIGRRGIGFDLDPAALATTALRLANSDAPHALPLFQVSP